MEALDGDREHAEVSRMRMTTWSRAWVAFVLCATLVGGGACQGPQSPNSPAKQWRQADKASDSSPAAPAAPEPNVLPRTHYAAGRLHESQNQLNRAIEQYQAAVTLDPKYVDAHNSLGVCLTRLGNYKQAEEHFVKAIELAPDRAHLRNNLAFCYISQRRWSDAEAELRNALELKPDFVRARVNLGLCLAQQHKFDAALEAFRLVLREDDAQFNMGLMYQSLGAYADASKAFQAAVDKNPRLVAAKERLAKVLPLAERAERKAAAEAKKEKKKETEKKAQVAAAATRPSGPVAGVGGTKAPPSPAGLSRGSARSDETGSKSKSTDTAQQASPLPRLPAEIMPVAREMAAALTGTLSRLAARIGTRNDASTAHQGGAEADKQYVVICDATGEITPPEDLDVQDDLWLGQLDPGRVCEEAEQIRALEEGLDGGREGTAGFEEPPSATADLGSLPHPPFASGNSIQIGAALLPDDPFIAFPHR
jgi:Flp pilus assembly protein TadD